MNKFLSSLLLFFAVNINKTTESFIPNINVNNVNMCPDYISRYVKYFNIEQSEVIVKKITGILPQVDSFAGYVLHTNDVLINKILNNSDLSLDIKKKLVLFLIELIQNGDNVGSQLLQYYHDLVSCLL